MSSHESEQPFSRFVLHVGLEEVLRSSFRLSSVLLVLPGAAPLER